MDSSTGLSRISWYWVMTLSILTAWLVVPSDITSFINSFCWPHCTGIACWEYWNGLIQCLLKSVNNYMVLNIKATTLLSLVLLTETPQEWPYTTSSESIHTIFICTHYIRYQFSSLFPIFPLIIYQRWCFSVCILCSWLVQEGGGIYIWDMPTVKQVCRNFLRSMGWKRVQSCFYFCTSNPFG